MKRLRARFVALFFATVASWVLGCSDRPATAPSIEAAASGNGGGVTVTSTDPNNAPQGVTLDVRVFGSGYDRGSKAQWARSGVLSPNVTTNSTQFVSPSELRANITIANVADTGLYDVLVTTSKGKKGIGSELFTVRKNQLPTPPPDPEIAFWDGTDLKVMNADGSNVTTLLTNAYTSRQPSWSPDGEGTAANPYHLVFEQNTGTCPLATVDVDTVGGAIHATNLHPLATPNYACAPSWSPLGDEIAYGGWQEGPVPNEPGPSSLFVISPTGSAPVALYTAPAGGAVFYSAWRAGGTAIAFTELMDNAGDNVTSVRVLNRTTGSVTTVVPAGAFLSVGALSWARTQDLLAMCVRRPSGKKFSTQEVDTVRLARDLQGNYVSTGTPGFAASGCNSTWSPNDARLAVNGITVVDLLTGLTQSLARGVKPDWRRF
jgi:hypothetical protein